jgi:hypothetical protein
MLFSLAEERGRVLARPLLCKPRSNELFIFLGEVAYIFASDTPKDVLMKTAVCIAAAGFAAAKDDDDGRPAGLVRTFNGPKSLYDRSSTECF